MPGPLEAAVVLVLVVEVPVRLPLPVPRPLRVLEEVQVLLQQRPVVQEALAAVPEVAVVVAVPIPHTTRCKTSRLDRGASGPTAPHRS